MDRPKLRKVDRHAHQRGPEALLVVRDPLGLADPFAIDAEFGVVLDLLDGTHTLSQVRQSLLMRHGMDLPLEDLRGFVGDLRDAGLLDDETFRDRWAQAHTDFLEATERAPVLAGVVYPEHPGELTASLERAVPSTVARIDPASRTCGLVVPHDPPDRAAAVGLLDRTLRGLPPADRLEAVVILGTDHGPGLVPYVVTNKPFTTPLGSVPCASAFANALLRRLPWVGREEIRHRDAISIEIAVVYLQHLYGETCPPIVPILCGQTVLEPREGSEDQAERFVVAMESLLEDRDVLLWVSAELTHAGEAYGRPALSEAGAAAVEQRDRDLVEALRRGKADGIAAACSANHPQGRPSGGPALSTVARLLPETARAQLVQYALVDAPDGTGKVGQAGVRMST